MKIIITILSLAVIYLLFSLLEKYPYNRESFGGIKERANLQNIRDGMGEEIRITDKLSIIHFNGSEVLLFSSKTKCGILLNCEYPPYYKVFGKCKEELLTINEFNLVRKNSKITTTVEAILSMKIKN